LSYSPANIFIDFSCVESIFQHSYLKPIYFLIAVTRPAPIVLPPSRIANRSPFSTAVGLFKTIETARLSPGITISTPLGRLMTQVMSAVLKKA